MCHIFRDVLYILSTLSLPPTTSSKPTKASKGTKSTKKSKATKLSKSTIANTATTDHRLPGTNLPPTMPESLWFSSKFDLNRCPKYNEWWNPLQSTGTTCSISSISPKPDKKIEPANVSKKLKESVDEMYERKLMDLSTPYLTYIAPSKVPKISLLSKAVRSSKSIDHNRTINEKRENFLNQIEYIGKMSKPVAFTTFNNTGKGYEA